MRVKIEGFRDTTSDWAGEPLVKVGDRATVIVALSDYADLKGGKFVLQHPGIEDTEFDAPARTGTGPLPEGTWFFGTRAVLPGDLSRVDRIDCTVTFTKACEAPTAFSLVGKANCAPEASPDVTIRCVLDEEAFAAARITVRPGREKGLKLKLTKAASHGFFTRTVNTIRTYVRCYVQLYFKDPEGNERPFPAGMPVRVMLGKRPQHALVAAVEDEGKLTLELIAHADVLSNAELTLGFGPDPDNNQVLCELPDAPPAQARGPVPGESDPTGTLPNRMFTWPETWTMREARWTVTNHDGRWKESDATFAMTKGGKAVSLGKSASRVKLVLEPTWQFVKFEFFDRLYGRSAHGNKPKSTPAVMLEGFRVKPTSPTARPDVRSNWWVKEGGETVQCVPWILQKARDGTASKRPSAETLLRFELPAKTCIRSTSATARARVIATDEQLKLGPERLQFYDLPALWHSQNYRAKLANPPNTAGWYEALADKPTTKAAPLVFSLDDIVLTDELGRPLDSWTRSRRLALFGHTFDDAVPDCSKEGLYLADAANKTPWLTKEDTTVDATRNYVAVYPGWTRLVLADGNSFDVFDRRTVASSPANPASDVIGARAAVRWVDATARLGATTMWEPDPSSPGYIRESADHRPIPGREFRGAGFPTRSDHGSMAIEPYYSQDYMRRFGKYEDVGSTGHIGRFDMLLLRGCGVAQVDGKEVEVAVNFWFHRICFDTSVKGPAAGSLADYQVAFARTILDRFNGLDAKNAQGRAELLPKDPTKLIKASVLSFIQVTPEPLAHFKIKLTDSSKGARDWRSGSGTGETGNSAPGDSGTVNGFVNAHEHGHQSAFPDEYNERWSGASYGQPSFYSTLPGDPFEMDGRTKEFQEDNSPLMNGNHTFHNRYYWQAAEWVRLATRIGMKVKLGTKYAEYWLPPYPTAQETRRHYAFWPVSASKNDQAIAPRAGLTANRGKVDLYLYALGADAFPIEALPKKENPPGSDPYDGLLMVSVRVKVNAWGVTRDKEEDLKALAHAIARVGRRFDSAKTRLLNHAWALTGVHGKGTPQEWPFQRCLVHFSPRLLVAGVAELDTVESWDNQLGTLKTQTIWTSVRPKLVNYNALSWDDPNKGARLDTLIGPSPEPTINPIAGFTTTVAGLNQKLNAFTSKPSKPVIDRYNAAKEVREWIATFANNSANDAHPERAAMVQLHQRFGVAQEQLGALYYVRDLEEKAKARKTRNTEHESLVNKIALAHPPHFTVTCKPGTPTKAEWDPLPVEGNLPAADAWVNLVPAPARNGGMFQRVKGRLAAYHKLDSLDLPARIKALGELGTAEVIATETSPRGAWVDRGKASLAQIGTSLTEFENCDPEDCEERVRMVLGAHAFAAICAELELTDATDKANADALLDRIEATIKQIQLRREVRALEKHARTFKAHLERWVSSTSVTLTANSPDGFEEAMLMAFPSMFGAYKSSSAVGEDDIKAFASKLGLEGLDVINLLDSGPPTF